MKQKSSKHGPSSVIGQNTFEGKFHTGMDSMMSTDLFGILVIVYAVIKDHSEEKHESTEHYQ